MFDQRTMREVNPKKDIWSFGCVLSEALIWSVFGISGLQEYRQLRHDATESIQKMKNTAYSGCFHDGTNVSSAVRIMHDRVRARRPPIFDLVQIIDDMLEGNHEHRPDAPVVRRRLFTALEAARRVLVKPKFRPPFNDQFDRPPKPVPSPGKLPKSNTFSGASHNFNAKLQDKRYDVETYHAISASEAALESGTIENRHALNSRDTWPHSKSLKRSKTEGQVTKPSASRSSLSPSFAQRIQTGSKPVESALGSTLPDITRNSGEVELPIDSKSLGTNGVQEPDQSQKEESIISSQPQSPQATVTQVLDWIQRMKNNPTSRFREPVSKSYLTNLHKKDQVSQE